MNENEAQTPVVSLALTPETPPEVADDFTCVKCQRSFNSAMALRMHKARVHGNLRGQPRTMVKGAWSRTNPKEVRLAHRREYQRQLRERYYAEGKNSKGEPMPKGWKPNPQRQAAANKRYKSWGAKLTGEKREAYLSKQREYHKTMYAKQKAAKEASENGVAPVAQNLTQDAASAILIAANVIRAVATGLKIGGV